MLSSVLASSSLKLDQLQLRIPDNLWPTNNSKQTVIGLSSAAALVTVLTYLYRRSMRAKDGPMVPYMLPFVGSTPEYRKDPKAFIEKWTKELGPVFRAYLFGDVVTVVTGQYARQVFLNEDFSFLLGIHQTFDTRKLAGCYSGDILPDGGFAFAVKKFINDRIVFYTNRVIKQIQEGMQEILGDVKEPKEVAHVFTLVQHLVAKASASVFVGTEISKDLGLIDSFKNLVIDIGSELRPRPWLEPFPLINVWRMWLIGKISARTRKHRYQLYNALKPVVTDRWQQMRNNPNWVRPDDVLQDLLENYETPKGADPIWFLVDWIILFIFAAVHTTSENTTIMVYRLLQNPYVMDDLLQEQKEVMASLGLSEDDPDEKVFTRSNVKMFQKLDSFCRESFRLQNDYLSLPHMYTGKRDIILGEKCVIHPGERVFVNLWKNHRAEDIQKVGTKDDLETFMPYRFLDQNKQATKVGEDHLSFGMGKHACPGRFFAVNEAKLIISMLLRRYKLIPLETPVFPTAERIKMPCGRFLVERRK